MSSVSKEPSITWMDFGIDDYLNNPVKVEDFDADSDSDFLNFDLNVSPPASVLEKQDLPELE